MNDLKALKRRSQAAKRQNARVDCDLATVCLMVKYLPGRTVWAHYGRRVSRSYAYAAFARAAKHGLIKPYQDGHCTRYTITKRGEDFLALED